MCEEQLPGCFPTKIRLCKCCVVWPGSEKASGEGLWLWKHFFFFHFPTGDWSVAKGFPNPLYLGLWLDHLSIFHRWKVLRSHQMLVWMLTCCQWIVSLFLLCPHSSFRMRQLRFLAGPCFCGSVLCMLVGVQRPLAGCPLRWASGFLWRSSSGGVPSERPSRPGSPRAHLFLFVLFTESAPVAWIRYCDLHRTSNLSRKRT